MTTEDLASIIREYTGTVVADLKAEIVALRAELQMKSASYDQQMDVLVRGAVRSMIEALPVPKDGKDGTNGKDGKDAEPAQPGAKGDPGEKGDPGIDGLSVKDALIDRDGHLVLCLSDGTTKMLGVVVGHDGATGAVGEKGDKGLDGTNGINGKDGTLEQLKMVRLDERTVQFCLNDGTPVEGGTIVLNHPVFQDTYRDDVAYKAGDLVQWDGSGYIALIDAPPMKPGSGTPDLTGWRLWIKKGRDGREGKPGEKGLDGKPGKDGKDRW